MSRLNGNTPEVNGKWPGRFSRRRNESRSPSSVYRGSATRRIRLPDNDPGANRWGLVGQTYQPELANAWSTCTQAFGEEANQDPVFEQSLFWLITGAKMCFY